MSRLFYFRDGLTHPVAINPVMSRTALVHISLALLVIGCGGERPTASDPSLVETQTPSPEAQVTAAPSPGVDPLRLPANVRPSRYRLVLQIDPSRERFVGTVDIDLTVAEPTSVIELHGQDMTVTEVSVDTQNGRPPMVAEWTPLDGPDPGRVRVSTERAVPRGRATLHVSFSHPFSEGLEGLYRVAVGDQHHAFTQFEALSARTAFPCFDEPGFKTPYDVTLVTPSGLQAFANSRELETTTLDNGMIRTRFATTEALPTYLIAFAVGQFDVVERVLPPTGTRSTPLRLRGIAVRGRGSELTYAMAQTGPILEALETWFGSAYPFDKLDIVAVPDFAAGAMENAGLVTFRDGLLLLGDRPPESQRRAFAYVTAHELAHQWFGNLVTMAWWDDVWLNEAFATWMEARIVGQVFTEIPATLDELSSDTAAAFDADALPNTRRIREPIREVGDINNAFDSITYNKGARVIEMMASWVGADEFRLGIQRYLTRFSRGNATLADFSSVLSETTEEPLFDRVLRSFVEQPGVPVLSTVVSCTGGHGQVSFEQSRYVATGAAAEPVQWTLPVCIAVPDGASTGQTTRDLVSHCRVMTEQTLSFPLDTCPDFVHPNPRGSGYYRATMSLDSLNAIARVIGRGEFTDLDRLSYSYVVRSSALTGQIAWGQHLPLLEPLAGSDQVALASVPMNALVYAERSLLEDSQTFNFRRYSRSLFGTSLARLGLAQRPRDLPAQRILRNRLLGFYIEELSDGPARAAIRSMSRSLFRPNGDHFDLALESVASDLRGLVIRTFVHGLDEAGFERLHQTLSRVTDSIIRGEILSAMATHPNFVLVERVLNLTLTDELRINEFFRVFGSSMSEQAVRTRVWEWFVAHYDAIAARVGVNEGAYLPYLFTGGCGEPTVAQLTEFLGPRLEGMVGGRGNLRSATETIELCQAGRLRDQTSARAWFDAWRPT